MTNNLELRARPLIFISHDSRDADLAREFADLIKFASAGTLDVFWSSDRTGAHGIQTGVAWYSEVITRMNVAAEIVCLLTPNSVERPYVLFEAGLAIGGNKYVNSILVGVGNDSIQKTPFPQYQYCEFTEDRLTALLCEMLRRNVNASPDEAGVRVHVSTFLSKAPSIDDVVSPPSLEQLLKRVHDVLSTSQFKTQYVGQYPQFFAHQVIDCLNDAKETVCIACDFPAYGFITDHKLYGRYQQAVVSAFHRIIKGNDASFTITVPNAETRLQLIETLFPSERFDDAIKRTNYQDGIAALVAEIRTHFRDDFKVDSVNDFYQAIALVNQSEIEKLRKTGINVIEVPKQLPLFAWIVDSRRATFAIPTNLPGEDGIEHAFATIDDGLVRALEAITRHYDEESLGGEVTSKIGAKANRHKRRSPVSKYSK